MNTTQEGPRRHGGRKHVQNAQQSALYRLPACIRILPEQAASTTKRAIVAGAAYGIIPPRVAEWIIRYGGLRHV